jgi:hypothetical protein
MVLSKFTYGIESLQLTQTMHRRIDAFHLRAIRQILKITTTYADRAHTNEWVYQQATQQAEKEVLPLSKLLIKRSIALLGHVLRESDIQATRHVTFKPNTATAIYLMDKRRVGGPKQQWIDFTARYAWQTIPHTQEWENKEEQQQTLLQAAQDRFF